jgi:hypothetical protein
MTYQIPNMTKAYRFILFIAVFCLIVAILLPFIVLSFYNHPSFIDDYVCAVRVKAWGIGGYVYFMLSDGSSRYIANWFHALNPLVWDSFTAYHYTPLFFILILTVSFYAFISQITRNIFPKSYAILGAVLFTCLILSFMPFTSEFIYWFASAVLYVPSVVFLFLFLAILVSHTRAYSKVKQVILFCLGVLILGMSEVTIVAWLLVLLYFTITFFVQKEKRLCRDSAILLSVGSLFFLFITFFLGSYHRIKSIPSPVFL